MLEWAAPAWLMVGAAAVAAVWWLHRVGDVDPGAPVAAAFLWRELAVEERAAGRPKTTDPRWWLRAALVAALAVAAAGPVWLGGGRLAVEVWFDDTSSMAAVDGDGTRAEQAATRLVAALTEARPGRATVRSLAEPGRSLVLDPEAPATWRPALAEWLRLDHATVVPPLAAEMVADAEHWLISDGADPALAGWLAGAPIHRVLAVGAETENAAVVSLSARRSLSTPATLLAAVTVANAGTRPDRRRLTVTAGDAIVAETEIEVAAGETATRSLLAIADTAGTLAVRLSPADALADDDALALDLAPLAAIRVATRGDCGPSLVAALRAHPAVVRVDGGAPPELIVACTAAMPDVAVPVLWLRRVDDAGPVTAPPVWDDAAGRLADLVLDPAWLRRIGADGDRVRRPPLLAADGVPLILAHDPPEQVIEVRIDLEAAALAGRPEVAALVAGLLDAAMGRPLLDGIAAATRPVDGARIAPTVLAAAAGPAAPASAAGHDLAVCAVVAALVLLAVDIALVVGAGRRRSARRPSAGRMAAAE